MAEQKKGDDDTGFLIGLGVIVTIFVFIPAVVATVLYLTSRRHLRRSEYVIVGLTSVVGLALGGTRFWIDYLEWLQVLIFGGDRWAVPLLPLLLMSGVGVSIAGLLVGTSIASKVPLPFKKKSGDLFDNPSILPTADEKAHAKVVAPPGGALTIGSDQHSVVTAIPVGQRSFPIGIDRNGVPVVISEDEIRMHGMLFGSTGSGKSKTIEALAGGLLDLGWSGMVLDLKEDTKPGGLRDWCFDYANAHSLPYQELRLSDPHPTNWFNPLAGMGADEARDTILSLQEFEAAYYKALNQKTLGQLTNLLYWAHQADPTGCPYPTMSEMGRILAATSMRSAAKQYLAIATTMIPGVNLEDFQAIVNPSKAEADSAPGLGARLTAMYDTQAGRTVLKPDAEGRRQLLDVTQGGLTYVGLDSQGKADLTKVISSAMLQRMSVYASQRTTGAVAGKRGGSPAPRFLIVDEANWVDRTIVSNLLSRARSAGISMVLCTQSPIDFDTGQRDAAGSSALLQNTNVVMIMSQGEPEAAERCADIIGKTESSTASQQYRDGELVDGGSIRREMVHRVPPDALRALEIGEAILRVGKPHERIQWLSVKMRDPKAGPRSR